MAATKKKRLTQREKRLRAEAKKELQAEGKIPPDKPRLNRKKFAEEVLAEFHEMGGIEDVLYIYKAIACMVGPKMPKITAEQVGVLKMLKIAVETKNFTRRSGRSTGHSTRSRNTSTRSCSPFSSFRRIAL